MRLIYPLFIVSLAALLFIAGFWLSPQKPVLVSFDSKTIKAEFIRQLALYNASDETVAQKTAQFKQLLQKTLTHYSQKERVVILDSETILAGNIDVTELIAKELAREMSVPR